MRHISWIIAAGSLVIAVGLLFFLKDGGTESEASLTFYCAMGVNEPVSEIIKSYEERSGVKILPMYDGSKKLFSPMKLDPQADLYLAADNRYMAEAEAAGVEIRETIPISSQCPVIVVNKENPLGIESFEDLTKPGVRLFLANPDFAAIGRVAREALGEQRWDELWEKKTTPCETVTLVAQHVNVEPSGAGIIWDSNVKQYPNLKFIRAPEFEKNKSEITIAVLGKSKHPTAALRFARFLTAEDQGMKTLKEAGYNVVEGDVWAEKPEILFYAGGLNKDAVSDTLKEFQEREGVQIQTLFAGCGSLVGRMDPEGLAEQPDIYFACANEYMDKVKELFYEPADVSGTDMVISVPHDKQGIETLADLAKPGMKIGLCDSEQSALGALSRKLLDKHGLVEAVDRNARDYTATAPALITKLSADALDAAIVYRANATLEAEQGRIDIVEIDDEDAYARQPIAIGVFSRHRQLCERLVKAILASESKNRFEALGFDWYGEAVANE